MRLNPEIWPPGGWRYTQPETGCSFQSDTFLGLVAKVMEHRRTNNLDAGDPDSEIQDQIISKNEEGVAALRG